jgi:EAL domain-containing protein (putative c-di-GMP-specific phosphodiesterase class I)
VKLVLNDVRGVESLSPGELAAIAGLRTRGVRVAMAHMGSGTSLSQLRVLDCDEVHVDPCFFDGVDDDERLEGLLLSIRELARRLRLKSVACGVHSDTQLALLTAQGWHAGRGPLFGRAVSSLAFASKYLAKADPTTKN